jgi:DNA-binding beta-propeller fold protein YncE
MGARRALLIAALALAAGCSTRERANPLDPENPDTRGRPTGFRAVAENRRVVLRWDVSGAPGLVGYQVYRRDPGDPGFARLALVPKEFAAYADDAVANGETYEYRLFFVFDAGEGALPASDHATPGSARPWMTDIEAARLVRLSADGRHVAETVSAPLRQPAEVVIDGTIGLAWVSDPDAGAVVGVLGAGDVPFEIGGFSSPGAMAVNPSDNTLWVCDETAGIVRHYAPVGSPGTPPSIGPFDLPIGVGLDPLDRSVWVCEQRGNLVRRFSTAGVQLGSATVPSPSRLAVDSLTRQVWVTSLARGTVTRLSSSVVVETTLAGFAGPVGVSIDHRRGRVWIADPDAGQVVALTRDGAVEFRVGGLPGARMVSAHVASGEAWAVVASAGSVVRIAPDGRVLERLGGFQRPWGIAVDDR